MNIYTATQKEKTFEFEQGIGLTDSIEVLQAFNEYNEKNKGTPIDVFSDTIVALPKGTEVISNDEVVVCTTEKNRPAVFLLPGQSIQLKKGSSKSFVGVDAMRTLRVSDKSFTSELNSIADTIEDKESVDYGAFKWLETGEIGRSSYAMCYWMTTSKVVGKMMEHKALTKGLNADSQEFMAHPHDPADFARCQKFLDAVPGTRAKIELMRKVSDEWSKLVDVWPELEDIYGREKHLSSAPELYEKMQSALGSKPAHKM